MDHVRRLCRSTAVVAIAAAIATGGLGVGTSYASTASGYLSILNQERTSHGLAPLRPNAELTSVAQAWALRLAASGVLRHNPALTSQVHNWQSVGENVGDGPDLRELADAFWASAEHRNNILDRDYTQVGVASVYADHRIWIVIDFRQPMQPTAPVSQQRGASRTSERAWLGRLLMSGTTGSAVAYVQRLLGLPVTGVFGARTQRAIFAFQRNHHLVVDGIVGPITWAALLRWRA